MTSNTQYLLKVLLLCAFVVFNSSCSKDSDLLSDYVISDTVNIAVDDIFYISSNGSFTLDVLANDLFENQENVTITEVSSTENGTVEIEVDNTLTYTPNTTEDTNEETEDNFTYTTEDENGEEETGDVTVNISTPTEDKENSTSYPTTGSGSIIWNTDFETVQWSKNGNPENNMWEVDGRNEVRTTSDARTGKQAIRLGAFNGDNKRNEINVDALLGWEEHWIGFSIKIIEETQKARTYMQLRNLREGGGVGPGVINPVTLRQGDPGQLYFQTSTVKSNVNKIHEDGASTGTERHNLNYNKDEYQDFVIHWVLDPTDGYLEIWHNGVKIIDERGTTTYRYAHVDGEPYSGEVFPKIGVYWSPNNPPQGEALYDSFKVWKGPGGTYEDVSPEGLSPN